MIKLNCIAIDDEPESLNIVEKFCNTIPIIQLQQCLTQVSRSQKYLKNYPVDLIFLDIQMPDINGIEFLKTINQNVMVIFISAYAEYAIEGFNLEAVDYLLKPIEFDRFKRACQKACDYYGFLQKSTVSEQRFLYVRSSYSLVKISYEDLISVKQRSSWTLLTNN